jgi:hypothetical protein
MLPLLLLPAMMGSMMPQVRRYGVVHARSVEPLRDYARAMREAEEKRQRKALKKLRLQVKQ